MVLVRMVPLALRQEQVARNREHRLKHARVAHAAFGDLLFDHALSNLGEIVHRPSIEPALLRVKSVPRRGT